MLAMLFNCRPERNYIEDEDARIFFSADTIYFDTVFTTIGTVTKSFRIYNPHSRFIKIDEIDLAGGSSSMFRMNVDGVPGYSFENYEIAPKDSMYVFVEATLDPNEDPNILRIQDSIIFSVNGYYQDVDLVAWGQDVHILMDSILDYSSTWIADKPYLIIGGILVDTLQSLTVEEGVTIHMHRDAGIYVKGTLNINGSQENPVNILGDRLEMDYKEIPGQWSSIYFFPGSMNNTVNYANILNGTVGLWADSVVNFDQPVLTVSNTEINRMSYDGILGRGTTIEAYNTIIGDCGHSSVELLYEGSYSFTHCTFDNNWNTGFSNRKTPTLFIANYFAYENDLGEVIIEARDIDKASFRNCIIYGSRTNEIVISKAPEGILDYTFNWCLTKMDEEEYDYNSDPNFFGITNNERPLYDTIPGSYQLDSLSPAINKGYLEYALEFPKDKKGDFRTADGLPDLGAFERIQN
jgi:hypothetical protein